MQLKVHLNQCLQNLEIPEIELMIDPEIIAQAERCKQKGIKMSEEDFGALASSPEFINRLENCVKQWLRDISRVTLMKYDLANGTVSQEIMFHASHEKSL